MIDINAKSSKPTWNCPTCNEELGELNAYCEYCKVSTGTIVYNPDKYYIRDIRIPHLCEGTAQPMTPQEELFSKLFNHEKLLVRDMDTLTLRAHREELEKIAFEARARLTAVVDEDNDRKKKANPDKVKGFSRSTGTDETTTNAINVVKERQKRMTAAEKVQASLEKLGISTADAEKLMSAGTILAKIKDKGKQAEEILKGNTTQSPLGQENGFVIMKRPEDIQDKPVVEPIKPLFNPFAK